MALRQCPDCKESISSSASSCPKCGFVPVVNRLRKFFMTIAAGAFAVMILALTNPGDAILFKPALLVLLISLLALSALLVF